MSGVSDPTANENCLTFHANGAMLYQEGKHMAILQVRGIDEGLYNSLKQKAKIDNRSISQEVIAILETYLSTPDIYNTNSTREFLKLSWDDTRNAAEIIAGIEEDRKNKDSFGEYNGVFD
jgi:plasmid stability protein